MLKAGIAGAGLLGQLLAFRLSQLGCSVTLFDVDTKGSHSAAYAAAGMLSPYSEIDADPLIFKLGIQSIEKWQQLLTQFSNKSWFQKRGSIVMAHNADLNELIHFANQINIKIPDPKITFLNANNMADYEPELECQQGIFLDQEASIDSRLFLYEINTINKNNKLITFQDRKIIHTKPYEILTEENTFYHFDWVFDCRGIGASEHFKDLRAVRGEIIYLYAPDVMITRPVRLLHPRYRLYIVPRSQSIYVVGASEIESFDHSAISVRTCLELLSAAYSLHRGFAEARVLETQVNLRPALSDNLPRLLHTKGLTAINGLYRHGYLLAPALIDEAINFLKNENYQTRYVQIHQEYCYDHYH